MSLEITLFVIFALAAAVSAVMVVTRSNPVIAALFLVVNFGSLAGLFLTLHAQFIAVTEIIVYAGAIMVLFLFVIMLIKPENEQKFLAVNKKIKLTAVFLAALILVQIAYIILFANPSARLNPDLNASVQAGTIESIGTLIFTKYILPFEAAGYLLLAATIGALVLAKKKFE
jgi:NADH-quinone oxidoreductase subunit J